MKVLYFPDTDTLYIQFSDHQVVDTHDLNEHTLVELDSAGNLVAMTVEHARGSANSFEFTFQQAAVAEAI